MPCAGADGWRAASAPEFVHKVVYYAAKKGFWVYIATNGRLLRPERCRSLGGRRRIGHFNFAMDAWDQKPSLPKALVPAQDNLEHILRKQYGYGYVVFFNINICRNNLQDVRMLTEYAHDRRVATDYHINETPMLEHDDHFKHLYDNPTYIRPEDWREVDALVDWLIGKNRAGYQMVNSVQRLQEIKAFLRMSSGLDLKEYGWNGDGTNGAEDQADLLALDARDCARRKWGASVCRMELPRRPEQRDHPHRWHSGALLPDVRSYFRLGKYRPAEARSGAALQYEENLPAALLLNPEPQPGVLLRRHPGDQVRLERGREETHEGKSHSLDG